MHIEKADVVDQLRARGDHDRAQQAESLLPRWVDTDQDAGLLHQLDLNVGDLAEHGVAH